MPLRWIGIACCALFLFSSTPVRAEHVEVYILAGQSNMDGRGKSTDLVKDLAPYAKPREDIRITYSNAGLKGAPVTSNGWQALQPGWSAGSLAKVPTDMFGPEVGFGPALVAAMPGKHIVFIKFSHGGTNLHTQWNPKTPDQIYSKFIPFVKKALEDLKKDGNTYTLRGMAWHQGESDAKSQSDNYQELLTAFIAAVRKDLGQDDLPFAIGELCSHNPEYEKVRAAQKATSEAVPHCVLVSSADLKTSDPATHFNAASQIELGKRFAEPMLRLDKPAKK